MRNTLMEIFTPDYYKGKSVKLRHPDKEGEVKEVEEVIYDREKEEWKALFKDGTHEYANYLQLV